ncbi:phosphate signaling complex protein PhoU [Halomicrobium sp. LC1Hm]|uniref:phosphate signaling complex protein PhoU n=1 Tax=Halomicrobium sp. LC1Hm TaxID=2610902 RepID=UPI001298245A|nr:phosphate signaling complex protein PhoU [Halomicrobium sp. LC1Hm]
MTRDRYEAELEALKEGVTSMATLVVERLREAARAYEDGDEDGGREIAQRDDEINELYLELESECIDLLALQQPVAGDLRFVVATFKILTDLERIADLAANIGRYAGTPGRDRLTVVPIADIADMASSQVADAIAAYVEADPEQCRTVVAGDTDLDQRCEAAADDLVRYLATYDAAGDDHETLLADTKQFLLTVRDLERVGDHAVNIAARTFYMIESDDELIY